MDGKGVKMEKIIKKINEFSIIVRVDEDGNPVDENGEKLNPEA